MGDILTGPRLAYWLWRYYLDGSRGKREFQGSWNRCDLDCIFVDQHAMTAPPGKNVFVQGGTHFRSSLRRTTQTNSRPGKSLVRRHGRSMVSTLPGEVYLPSKTKESVISIWPHSVNDSMTDTLDRISVGVGTRGTKKRNGSDAGCRHHQTPLAKASDPQELTKKDQGPSTKRGFRGLPD